MLIHILISKDKIRLKLSSQNNISLYKAEYYILTELSDLLFTNYFKYR